MSYTCYDDYPTGGGGRFGRSPSEPNLSGSSSFAADERGQQRSPTNIDNVDRRANTALPTGRRGIAGGGSFADSSNSFRRTGTASLVPSLDLGRAGEKETVTYTEPKGGPQGLAIPMVRTGGLSGHK
jgi:hypothetical protein